MNIAWFHKIGTKLTLSLALFLVVLTGLITFLIVRGSQQTEADVTARSKAGLEQQGSQSLLQLTRSEAFIRTMQLDSAASLTREAAAAFIAGTQTNYLASSISLDSLTTGPAGNRYLDDPARLTDILIYAQIPDSPQLEQNLRQSSILAPVFSGQFGTVPNIAALYYIDQYGLTRYYPAVGLQDIVPPTYPVTHEIFFTVAAPASNPERSTKWTPPYIDPANNGLLITASSPVYADDTFRGVIGADVSLNSLVRNLDMIQPTEHGYAFLIDHSSKLVAATAPALETFFHAPTSQMPTLTETLGLPLIITNNAPLEDAIDTMRQGGEGVTKATVDGQELMIAYAPLPNVQWTLIVVAPVDEVTAQADTIAAAIREGAEHTLQNSLFILGVVALLALVIVVVISRRITSPLVALVAASQSLAEGSQSAELPIQSRDELGAMARSFNQMAQRVFEARAKLEGLNQSLEATVQDRTRELEAERASLQQALDELSAMSTTVARLTTPIIPISAGVVVVPIIGSLDANRLERMQVDMLEQVAVQRAHTVIIDVTGLDRLDASMASSFTQGLEALMLLGARPILVGVHPDIAQHLVLSDIDLHTLETLPDLQAAVMQTIQRSRR